MEKVKLSPKDRGLLVIAPLMAVLPLIIKHFYTAVPDEAYGFFVGICIGVEIVLLTKMNRRKKQLSGSDI